MKRRPIFRGKFKLSICRLCGRDTKQPHGYCARCTKGHASHEGKRSKTDIDDYDPELRGSGPWDGDDSNHNDKETQE